jgi:hypothetical protein
MKRLLFATIGAMVLSLACSTSRLTTSWKAENFEPRKYNKVMILGLIREADRSIQENMENHFVGDLRELGYNAVSSLAEYGPKAFDKMEEQAAIDKLKSSGVDAVITIVLLDKKKESKYVPGNMYYTPYGYYYNRFWGYRGVLYRRIYEPGYYVTDTRYFWESNLYDMSTQQLLYSAQTQSFDPSSSASLGHEYGKMIVQDMVKKNVLIKSSGAKGF